MSTPIAGSGKLRSALFVDFDNIFTRLSDQDYLIADHFATAPHRWLKWLENYGLEPLRNDGWHRRAILVRRCYLNPQAYQKYRPYFIRSGFEVVDCPPLTRQGKTSSDIHIVMDMLDKLGHNTRFDEFILLSADADFTPLVLRLREHDRRTMLLAVGYTSPAYKAACSNLIDQDLFLDHMAQSLQSQQDSLELPTQEALELLQEAVYTPDSLVTPLSTAKREEAKRKVARCICELLQEADCPVAMSVLAQEISKRVGDFVANSGWLGMGSFKGLLTVLDIGELKIASVTPGYVYDPKRHAVPEESGTLEDFRHHHPELFELAAKVHDLTDTPLLRPEHYRVLMQAMATEINEQGYNLTTTSKNTRDRCSEQGIPVARAHVNFVLRGIAFQGHRFGEQEETPAQFAECFLQNVQSLCESAQFELTESENEHLRAWLMAEIQPVSFSI
ncbi:NYN domain-containing protein [Allopseudospirillum japonicum]|uniref:NYN domain-containing protein n=1 Tax=Allopseudospirillum japonicum TaxID=64971 RepID=A0A1H6TI77_9GAMM|nr:NYN domain-containing protein [Allopseudospirillum japonicum]SEI79748.1 NYN domain-containing protein [Allopseudospirillum japonicum]